MQNYKILIVDAVQLELGELTKMLESEYVVHILMDGSQCLDLTKEIMPDLVLLDYQINDSDSISICKQLKADSVTKDIPVLMLSEATSLKNRLKGYDAGAEDFIQKPFDEIEIIVKIKLILGYNQELNQLKDDSEEAVNAAVTIANELGEVAAIISFFRKSFSIRSIDRLADGFLKVLLDYNLTATLLSVLPVSVCMFLQMIRSLRKTKCFFKKKAIKKRFIVLVIVLYSISDTVICWCKKCLWTILKNMVETKIILL